MLVHRWGEGRVPSEGAESTVVTAWHGHEDAVSEAERLVRSRYAAWNRADSRGLRAALHLPHISLPGARLSIRESEPELLRSPDFRALASVEGWHRSGLDRLDVLQASPDKVHCVVAFGRHAAVQCGFCTPGMLLTAKALAARGIGADRGEIAAAMSGNLCRCTGYVSILDSLTELLGGQR